MPCPYIHSGSDAAMKLLVRATNWLGDAVISIPALREIRRVHPGWEVVLLARPWVADLYRREDFCGRILLYENKGRHAGLAGKWRLAGELRREGFDRAILLQNAFDAALLAWLARIPERIGYARDGRGPLLTRAVPAPRPGETAKHERFYYLEMLRRAGLIDQVQESSEIRLGCAAEAAASGRAYWRDRGFQSKRWVGISPGAANSRAKQWPPERFADVGRVLGERLEARVAVFGSASEAELCNVVAEGIGSQAENLAGQTTLTEFIDLTAACDVFVTNDSGAMHIAAALGVPTVAVFGPTDELATGPVSSSVRVVREPVDCSPCLLRDCPIDHRCMTRVEAGRVVEEAGLALQAGSPAPLQGFS